ncbi:molybdopterin-dependent oxidoreductase [Micromonospora sp. NBC_01699]|uniref:molybdopterin-dependent oxidoreductase n=1 Tax=Micromonospora sp. NBC_01699 TaxID=2975984 RepID=UPI002E27E43B|nr:molybdopterin-dependent oxidoreductase [Micromonospora sp. NBC_01699]
MGLLAATAGVTAAELLATLTRPQAGPLVAVGSTLIDAAPTPVKEFAVRTFGTYDKPLLLGGIGLALAGLAVLTGLLARRRSAAGLGGAALLGVLGAVAALLRPGARAVDVLPSVAGALVAAGVLRWLLPRPASAAEPVVPRPGEVRPIRGPSRRALARNAALVAAGTALGVAGTGLLRGSSSRDAERSREAVRLPAPADPAAPLPDGVGPAFHTRNADFYRVDTALTVPRLDTDTWRLRIRGMVDRPLELSFADLLDRELVERDITLNCVSNEVGGPYVGTARWLGVPLAPLLRAAGIRAGADQVVARSSEGMTIGTPVETVLDGRDAMLAVGMNGEPLPLEHGFPVRMLTPGLFGYAGACKWVVDLELSTFASFDAYWVRRGWAREAPVKTASRIDRPAPFARLPAGQVVVAGVAWAQGRGIAAVEVSVDSGPWQPSTLLPVPSTDTWVQWRYQWPATPGGHSLRVRATDRTGDVQTESRTTPFPDGATGWHTIAVTVI